MNIDLNEKDFLCVFKNVDGDVVIQKSVVLNTDNSCSKPEAIILAKDSALLLAEAILKAC
ncbi:MAG: hypothetical protein ACXWAT_00500 [Methylobacter sp.]